MITQTRIKPLSLSHTTWGAGVDTDERRFSISPVVIFTADDFGRSPEINRAVIRAHCRGVLTSASLMVGAPAAEQAVQLARKYPALAVGLHLVMTDSTPVLPVEQIRGIVGPDGSLRGDPLSAGLRYAISRSARSQLRVEIRAQFERFAATGLHPSHVDGHMQMHVHPTVFEEVIALASEFGFDGIRLPREPIREAFEPVGRRFVSRAARVAALSTLAQRRLALIRASGLTIVDRVYGIAHSGEMSARYVAGVLGRLGGISSAELIFHPSDGATAVRLGPNPTDLATLISPAIRARVERLGLQPGTYGVLARAKSGVRE